MENKITDTKTLKYYIDNMKSQLKKKELELEKLKLRNQVIKDLFKLVKVDIEKVDDLEGVSIKSDVLMNHEKIIVLYNYIPELKKVFSTHRLNALHVNSLEKQKLPAVNMIRQIVRCLSLSTGEDLKVETRNICKGYEKSTGRKIFDRSYVIKKCV